MTVKSLLPPLGRKTLILLLALNLALAAGAEYRKPKPEQVVGVTLGQGLNGADLERLKIGHQAGVLKVIGGDGTTVKFLKGGEDLGSGGIDGREWAPLSPSQRDEIVVALGVKDPNAMATSLMATYTRVSRAHVLALLGVLAYPGQDTAPLKPELRAKVLQFFRNRLQPAEDNIVRRQAVLALAIQPKTDAQTVASMLNFLKRDHNAWNTFGVVQYFDYHREQIQKMPDFQGYLTQLAANGSPQSDQILRGLKVVSASPPGQAAPAPVAPKPPASATPKPAAPATPKPAAPATPKPAPATPAGMPTPVP